MYQEQNDLFQESGDELVAAMLTTRMACDMARSLPEVTEKDHFGSDAFCANKRIFATVWHDKNEVNLMLSPVQQRHFLEIDGEGFTEIDNAWGKQGATKVQLEFVDRNQFAEALKLAWEYSGVRSNRSKSNRSKSNRSKKTAAKRRNQK